MMNTSQNPNTTEGQDLPELGTYLAVFTPSGKRAHFKEGTPLLQAARELGVDIDSVCGGRGICGRCQVIVSEGEFAKFGVQSKYEHLNALTESEKRFDAKRGLKANRRLSCHCTLHGDIVIDVPPESQVHKQVVRKSATTRSLELDPVTSLYYVEVSEMDMHHPSSDITRVLRALEYQWGLSDLQADSQLLMSLNAVLKEGKHCITAAVYDSSQVIAVWPGLASEAYGLAIDIGSTTIAAHLCELASGTVLASAGLMNPQIRFGEDLMSRVSYVMMNPEGTAEMTSAVRDAINSLAHTVSQQANIDLQHILEVVFVANPVMHHLLLGIDPTPLGSAPFALATDNAMTLRATDLDLLLHPNARVYILPCIAGHVGADTAGMVLAEAPQHQSAITLLVDVGTNAEIVLGNRERLAACSSPTGPALEGAQISAGQRAAAGAIERVRIDPETLTPRFKVIGCELWSDDPGFAEARKDLKITGICGSGIIEVLAEMYLARIIVPDGHIDGESYPEHPRLEAHGSGSVYRYIVYEPQMPGDVRVTITQNDVRAVQLAKAALFAGIQLLQDHLKITEIQRIALAGAFGSHIDPKYAMVLGLIPDCNLSQVHAVGNAAGDGALQALLSKRARLAIEEAVQVIEKIETAVEPKFQSYFVDALAIPNKTVPFPKLEKVVKLPEGTPSHSNRPNRRSNRRNRRTQSNQPPSSSEQPTTPDPSTSVSHES